MQLTWVTSRLLFLTLLFSCCALGQTAPATAHPVANEYRPITGKERINWFARSSIGPESLAAGLFTSAIGTAENNPREYGPHWDGFGKRYGIRLTGIATSNAMEAGIGSLWGEDPRYFVSTDRTLKGRVGNIMRLTFEARRRDGQLAPAYTRYISISGSNFISNAWRADSSADAQHAAIRTLYGFLGRMGGNAFKEFWPDIKTHVFRRGR